MNSSRKQQWIHGLYFVVGLAGVFLVGSYATSTPGVSVPAAVLGTESPAAKRMLRHVTELSEGGERRLRVKDNLDRAREYLSGQLTRLGYKVKEQEYEVEGMTFTNLEVEVRGGALADEIVVVGAHYDSHRKSSGADDNASGCAVLLELAQELRHDPGPRTLRFVFFTLGEWPHLRTDDMGSRRWIQAAKHAGDDVVAMLALDSVGVYYDQPNSQSYPPLLSFYYPSAGNFVGFLGNVSSRDLLRKSVQLFRDARRMPAEGLIVPGWAPSVSMSDHWSFWKEGIPAVLVTDTMGWRYGSHHGPLDTRDGLDFERMTLVVESLIEVCRGLRMSPSL